MCAGRERPCLMHKPTTNRAEAWCGFDNTALGDATRGALGIPRDVQPVR
jgi:hypothetical protein